MSYSSPSGDHHACTTVQRYITGVTRPAGGPRGLGLVGCGQMHCMVTVCLSKQFRWPPPPHNSMVRANPVRLLPRCHCSAGQCVHKQRLLPMLPRFTFCLYCTKHRGVCVSRKYALSPHVHNQNL